MNRFTQTYIRLKLHDDLWRAGLIADKMMKDTHDKIKAAISRRTIIRFTVQQNIRKIIEDEDKEDP
jgi:hypothetical protein